jgi:hypothetical protein
MRATLLTIGSIGLLTLMSCGGTGSTVADSVAKPVKDATGVVLKDSIDATRDKVNGAVSGFTSLNEVVNNTKTAVDAGDFAKATAELSKFNGFWAKVEDGVRTKAPEAHGAIESNIKTAETALKSADQAKATEALNALNAAVATAMKP